MKFSVLLLLIPACTFISDADVDAKFGSVDDTVSVTDDADGDGYALSVDCDDTDPGIHPDAIEVWYDGVDQDCDGADDFDQDADGYDSSLWPNNDGVYGDDCYDEVDSDCLRYDGTEADCSYPVSGPFQGNPIAPSDIHPAATDTWYDGTDQDCGGNDDYDQDYDGFSSYAECDDTNADLYPNPEIPEVWYNGIDENCDGNDADQDGDTFLDAGYSGGWSHDMSFYSTGDCWDDPADMADWAPINGFPSLSAADVNPDADETWYDSLDQDCAGNDDFDQDADGYETDAYRDASGTYGDDCDDLAGDANPRAVDAWYDNVDADCQGNNDFDQDGDGYGQDGSGLGADCDDADRLVSPGGAETCATSYDDDCDGETNDLNAQSCAIYYSDEDGDSYAGLSEACICVANATYKYAASTDCDDADSAINPGVAEVCDNGIDDNCDNSGGACAPSDRSLADASGQYSGEAFEDIAGWAVAGAGDANGDSYDDFLVGAPYNDSAGSLAGVAYLVLGSGSPGSASLSTAIRYTGEAVDNEAGYSVSGAGDVDGDGFDDVLVGARGNDDGGYRAGAAYLVLGGATPSSADLGTAISYTGAPDELAGRSVSGSADVNADGYADILVGACDGTSWNGAAYLVLGGAPASSSLSTAIEYPSAVLADSAGYSVSFASDVDGDGYDDMLVGAYTANAEGGAAYLMLGSGSPTSASLSTAVQYAGEAAGNRAGMAVSGVGDVNGDGYGDVVVGAYGNSDTGASAGAAYLVLGSGSPTSASLSTAVEYTGATAGDQAGYSVSGAGDVDGDGHADFLIGAAGNSDGGSTAGAGYLVLGRGSPASASVSTAVQYTGEAAGDRAGSAVSGAGDVDGDGYLDLLLGAWTSDDPSSDAGSAYLILGTGL